METDMDIQREKILLFFFINIKIPLFCVCVFIIINKKELRNVLG